MIMEGTVQLKIDLRLILENIECLIPPVENVPRRMRISPSKQSVISLSQKVDKLN